MPRPQFRLRSLFLLTALVAVGCLVGPPIVREVRARFWPPHREVTCRPYGGGQEIIVIIPEDEGPMGPVPDVPHDAPDVEGD